MITERGEVFCPGAQHWVHISKYRTLEVIEGVTRFEDIWFEENGKLFGRPNGYCRVCSTKKSQGPIAWEKYLERLEAERTAIVTEEEAKERKRQEDYEAYQDALFETLERLGLATD